MVQTVMMLWHAAAVMTDWADTSDARVLLPDSVLICAAHRPPSCYRTGIRGGCRCKDMPAAQEAVDTLREQGQCVVIDYGIGYNGSEEVTGRLKQVDGIWKVIALND